MGLDSYNAGRDEMAQVETLSEEIRLEKASNQIYLSLWKPTKCILDVIDGKMDKTFGPDRTIVIPAKQAGLLDDTEIVRTLPVPDFISNTINGIHSLPTVVSNATRAPLLDGRWESWTAKDKAEYLSKIERLSLISEKASEKKFESFDEAFDAIIELMPIVKDTIGPDLVKEVERKYGFKMDDESLETLRRRANRIFGE